MGLSHEQLVILAALAYVAFTAPPAAAWYGDRIRSLTVRITVHLADIRRALRTWAREGLRRILEGPEDPPRDADSTRF